MTVTLPGAPRAGVLRGVGNQVGRRSRSCRRADRCTRNTSAHRGCSSTSLSPITHPCCLWKRRCDLSFFFSYIIYFFSSIPFFSLTLFFPLLSHFLLFFSLTNYIIPLLYFFFSVNFPLFSLLLFCTALFQDTKFNTRVCITIAPGVTLL